MERPDNRWVFLLDSPSSFPYTRPLMQPLAEQQVAKRIRDAKHVLLLTDERLDGDTLGSTLGLFHILRDMDKDVTVFSPRVIPKQYHFIPGVEHIRNDDAVFDDASVDLVVIADCSDGEYITQFLPKMPRKVPLVSFDHHATNPRYGTYNLVEPHAASTADVVWRFVQRSGFPVDQKAAQCLLTGICTDTSLFSTSNTTAAAFEASVELTKLGAKLHDIIRHTMMDRPVPVLRVWGLLFERLHYHDEFDALATALTQADLDSLGKPEVDTSSISNFLNATLDHADAILILRESDDGGVKGSLRSRGRDVAALAEKYGGGGHKCAAGFKVSNARLVEKDGKWSIHKVEGGVALDDAYTVNFLNT